MLDPIPPRVLSCAAAHDPPRFATCPFAGRTASGTFEPPSVHSRPALPSPAALLVFGVAMAGCLAFFRRLRHGDRDCKSAVPRHSSLVPSRAACSADPGWSISAAPPSPTSVGSASASDASSCRFPSGAPTPQGPLSPAGAGYSKDATCLRLEPQGREGPEAGRDGRAGQVVLKGHMITGDHLVLFVYINLSPIR